MDSETNDVPEDGEILDYEPLPRPSVASNLSNNSFRSNPAGTCSSDSSENSDSDDGRVSRKKPKLQKIDSGRRNKYNVWASHVQTSQLMDEICSWETGLKNRVMDKSRDVESYYHFPEETEAPEAVEAKPSNARDIRKRRHDEVVDLRTKLGQRQSNEKDYQKSRPRYLSELRASSDDSVEDVTQDITLKLCEEKEDLVLRVVTVLGKEKAIDIFNKTKSLEEEGGMMVMNGSRRRTPGGVFLQLIKKDDEISRIQKNQIFIDDVKVGSKFKKSKVKSCQKKEPEVNARTQTDNNFEEGLPVLLERKDLVSPVLETSNDSELLIKNAMLSTITAEERGDPRQLAVYEDIFDDNPCDIEFA